MVIGGLLVGFGTRMGNGCTSGYAIVDPHGFGYPLVQ
jgi:uncharacterized membrane protein YedE/YeeE